MVTPTLVWGCGWPFAGGGEQVLGAGLVTSLVSIGNSELLQPHPLGAPYRVAAVLWAAGGCMPLAGTFGAYSSCS